MELEAREREELKAKGTIMKFIDGNLLQGTEKRLTMVGHEEMSVDNVKKLREAYKHPFEKIPKAFFSTHAQNRGKTIKNKE